MKSQGIGALKRHRVKIKRRRPRKNNRYDLTCSQRSCIWTKRDVAADAVLSRVAEHHTQVQKAGL